MAYPQTPEDWRRLSDEERDKLKLQQIRAESNYRKRQKRIAAFHPKTTKNHHDPSYNPKNDDPNP